MLDKIKKVLIEIGIVTKQTLMDWFRDNIPTYGASLAFYTIFSIAPLIIITVAVVGFIFGESATTGQLNEYMTQIMGRDLADALQKFIKESHNPTSGIIATAISLGIILFAATTIITQLKDSLNIVWNVTNKVDVSGFKRFIINRIIALSLIFTLASLFMLSMFAEIALNFMESFLDPVMPGGVKIWSYINSVFTFFVLVLLFAIIFKLLPDVHLQWSDVAVGAVVTALLFLFGRFLIGVYMGSATGNTYGAAGSFVVFLVWVYYNAMVFFLGAEFTYVYTMRYGSKVKPAKHAEFTRIYEDDRDHDAYGGT